MITALGLLAGILTTLCWIPQLRKSWQTRSTEDISWLYLGTFAAGVALWLAYGVLERDPAVAFANALTALLLLLLIGFKARFDHDLGRAPRRTTVAALLLDMDGTLVDSDAAVERAWMRWADEYDVDRSVVEPLMHGGTAHTTARAVAPHWDEAKIKEAGDRQLALQYDDLADVVRARGADALLRYLDDSGLPWAVVTSADRKLAAARLHAAAIDVPLLVTVQDVGQGKPHPEGYLLAADRLGVAVRDCLVVEDSPTGVRAGQRAGAQVAGLRGTPADVAVDDLADVAALLATRS